MSLHTTRGFLPVTAAISGNALVTCAKLIAAFASGSSVMFSEAIHSGADTTNQILLLIGLRRSLKKADDTFEYGYGNERFFWALLSACGIFFIGAGVTAYNGIHSLIRPAHVELDWIVFVVLLFSFVVESYSFYVAGKDLWQTSRETTWRGRLRGADSATLAVLLEDAIAVFGVVVASVALLLSYYTENTMWDSIGSLIIASLLAAIALILIVKNRAYLIGKSMPEGLQDEVIALLTMDPAIERVIDFKSTTVGWDAYRIKFEIEFNGSSLAREAYGKSSMRKQYDELANDFEAFKRFSAEYADRIPRLVGRRIDEIEKRIRDKHPSIRHIDIEIN
ncbi:MAG TPA: cation diffusion facilitator family transporter [Candidatus Paceibacterota bacterium]